MATQEERDDLWNKLWEKYTSINEWEHEFNRITPIERRPDHENLLASVQIEREQVAANLRFLQDGAEIPFPSPQTIAVLQAGTGELQQATLHSDNANRFFQAVTTVFTTWPVSGAG